MADSDEVGVDSCQQRGGCSDEDGSASEASEEEVLLREPKELGSSDEEDSQEDSHEDSQESGNESPLADGNAEADRPVLAETPGLEDRHPAVSSTSPIHTAKTDDFEYSPLSRDLLSCLSPGAVRPSVVSDEPAGVANAAAVPRESVATPSPAPSRFGGNRAMHPELKKRLELMGIGFSSELLTSSESSTSFVPPEPSLCSRSPSPQEEEPPKAKSLASSCLKSKPQETPGEAKKSKAEPKAAPSLDDLLLQLDDLDARSKALQINVGPSPSSRAAKGSGRGSKSLPPDRPKGDARKASSERRDGSERRAQEKRSESQRPPDRGASRPSDSRAVDSEKEELAEDAARQVAKSHPLEGVSLGAGGVGDFQKARGTRQRPPLAPSKPADPGGLSKLSGGMALTAPSAVRGQKGCYTMLPPLKASASVPDCLQRSPMWSRS